MPTDLGFSSDATEREVNDYLHVTAHIAARRIETLQLYEPLPFQQEYHKCATKECVLRKGNQVGGSLAGFVEDARAATGQDPYDKYPKRDGVLCCLGFGEKHIGRVIHRYLFRAGAFQIIRDKETGHWRVFRPWPESEGGDADRIKESKPAPPLIPQRFIDGKISWDKRSENIFSYVKLTTGWEIYALNSAGDPSQAQGFEANLYHIDEDVATGGWYEEAIGRTSMHEGMIRWTAVPHAKTDDLMNMIQRGIDQEDEEFTDTRTTVCIAATIFDNPYMPKASKEANTTLWKSMGEDVYRMRALGELTLDSVRMYPTFSKELHNAIKQDEPRLKIQKILAGTGGEPPPGWMRSMVVDPGHTVLGVAFLATPPPKLRPDGEGVGNFIVMYDELYLKNADADMFGEAIEAKLKNRSFQYFIIDAHGGNLREITSGLLPKRQYEAQLEQRKLRCEHSGCYFTHGSDDIKGRELKLRSWLSIRPDGTTKFIVNVERCPNFVREMLRFKKKTVRIGGQDIPTDDGNRRSNSHLIECVEYAAAHGLEYVKPKVKRKMNSHVQEILDQRKRRAATRRMRKMEQSGASETISLGPRGT